MYISLTAGEERGENATRDRARLEKRGFPAQRDRVRESRTRRIDRFIDSLREMSLAFLRRRGRERIRSCETRKTTRGRGREWMEDKGERRRNGRGVKKERSGSASWNKGSS
jgi:hypothetical protein